MSHNLDIFTLLLFITFLWYIFYKPSEKKIEKQQYVISSLENFKTKTPKKSKAKKYRPKKKPRDSSISADRKPHQDKYNLGDGTTQERQDIKYKKKHKKKTTRTTKPQTSQPQIEDDPEDEEVNDDDIDDDEIEDYEEEETTITYSNKDDEEEEEEEEDDDDDEDEDHDPPKPTKHKSHKKHKKHKKHHTKPNPRCVCPPFKCPPPPSREKVMECVSSTDRVSEPPCASLSDGRDQPNFDCPNYKHHTNNKYKRKHHKKHHKKDHKKHHHNDHPNEHPNDHPNDHPDDHPDEHPNEPDSCDQDHDADNEFDLNYNSQKYYCNSYANHQSLFPNTPSKMKIDTDEGTKTYHFKPDDVCCIHGDPKKNFKKKHVKCCMFAGMEEEVDHPKDCRNLNLQK